MEVVVLFTSELVIKVIQHTLQMSSLAKLLTSEYNFRTRSISQTAFYLSVYAPIAIAIYGI